MDKKPASGHRIEKRRIVTTTPTLLYPEVTRSSLLLFIEGATSVILGSSGSVAAGIGVLLPQNYSISDSDSMDGWWGKVTSSSGIVDVVAIH